VERVGRRPDVIAYRMEKSRTAECRRSCGRRSRALKAGRREGAAGDEGSSRADSGTSQRQQGGGWKSPKPFGGAPSSCSTSPGTGTRAAHAVIRSTADPRNRFATICTACRFRVRATRSARIWVVAGHVRRRPMADARAGAQAAQSAAQRRPRRSKAVERYRPADARIGSTSIFNSPLISVEQT